MDNFSKNMDSLSKSDILTFLLIRNVQNYDKFEIFQDEKDNANINIYDKELKKPLYIGKPLDEILDFMRTF